MRLFELAYCCRLYGHFTGYDDSLGRLRAHVGSEFDPSDAADRAALFGWLNDWGCRQFAKDHHATTASGSLVEWAASWLRRLPDPDVHLTDLSSADLDLAAAAYDALRVRPASWRTLPSGRSAPVTFGPTGAAKTLFAFRPNVFPPWDEPIRAHFGYGEDPASFRRYLTTSAELLRGLASEAGAPVSALPRLVGRPDSSAPKLVDEYNWVVITKRCPPPSPDEVRTWAEWSQSTATLGEPAKR